ncbi:MAG: EVE domain-containing protein [Chloroflexota bacterium]|jgi:predicted RNA-binding protein with PUA-like domain|nr:MAG: EVE domain-containing protein [SAR202 cluster bacterium]MCH2672278.1 EVE domain-containing protein [Dehalococcoidia bacterium]MEE3012681.1 EVE domain-containing protein [Chloroflexota bacterium]GIS93297.1 MAG: EVE domain-containing protein [Dehalococcoidia bacterium]|tara:strand:+ start:1113 stop:1583 length:471 start_codon:yes stop_codon:yes gene_type:complete
MSEKRYWLFKSEPTAYSFDDLMNDPDGWAEWDGVRNYQARNMMRDDMKVGDSILFYHSNAKPMAVVGIASVVREGYDDFHALDPDDKHYDPKATPEKPIWSMVDIKGERPLARPVTLAEIKENPKLKDMLLIRKGMRLSIQPITKEEFIEVVSQGG